MKIEKLKDSDWVVSIIPKINEIIDHLNATPIEKSEGMCNDCFDNKFNTCKVKTCMNYGKDWCQCDKCQPKPKQPINPQYSTGTGVDPNNLSTSTGLKNSSMLSTNGTQSTSLREELKKLT